MTILGGRELVLRNCRAALNGIVFRVRVTLHVPPA